MYTLYSNAHFCCTCISVCYDVVAIHIHTHECTDCTSHSLSVVQESLREKTLALRKHVQENESLEFRNQQVC